jgi:hypothetical protein
MRTFLAGVALAPVLLASVPPVAHAQQAPAPLVVERVPTALLIAPDYKVSDVDGEVGQLAGLYGGRVVDDALLVGGALYWLANGSDTFKLTYGGLLVGWSAPEMHRVRFGVRGLAGFGSATLPIVRSVPVPFAERTVRFGARGPVASAPGAVQTFRFGARDDFLVFEPQGVVKFDMTNHVTINGGVGYRAVAMTDALRDRLHGATASLGLEFDW